MWKLLNMFDSSAKNPGFMLHSTEFTLTITQLSWWNLLMVQLVTAGTCGSKHSNSIDSQSLMLAAWSLISVLFMCYCFCWLRHRKSVSAFSPFCFVPTWLRIRSIVVRGFGPTCPCYAKFFHLFQGKPPWLRCVFACTKQPSLICGFCYKLLGATF